MKELVEGVALAISRYADTLPYKHRLLKETLYRHRHSIADVTAPATLKHLSENVSALMLTEGHKAAGVTLDALTIDELNDAFCAMIEQALKEIEQ